MTDKILILTTCADAGEAERIAHRLVEARLAACVTSSSPVRSVYHWQGVVEDQNEIALTIKTRRDLFARVSAEIKKAHSYSTPEILVVPVVDGSSDYLGWLDRELAPPE